MKSASSAKVDPTEAVTDATNATEATRARLKAAALRCVARWGLAKTGLGDIAKEAGCARQTVYNHYPDADAVISAALFDASAAFVGRLLAAIRACESPGDRVLEGMCFCITNLPNEPMLKVVASPEGAPFANVAVFRSEPAWALVRGVAAECLAPDPKLARHVDELAEMMTRTLLSLLVMEAPVARSERELRAFLARWLLGPLGLTADDARGRARDRARRRASPPSRGTR